MRRFQKFAFVGLVVAIPTAAQAFRPTAHPCFTSGTTTYQISVSAPTPDYRVRIDNLAAHPDLRMRLVDRPEIADFVLVDDVDGTQEDACAAPAPLKTIRIDDGETLPDLTISLASEVSSLASKVSLANGVVSPASTVDAPELKLYVGSMRFTHEEAAALFGVMWQADRIRNIALQR